MSEFRVGVACDVPAYARVRVEADSEAEAVQLAKRDIAGNGFQAISLDYADLTADWENSFNPGVVDDP